MFRAPRRRSAGVWLVIAAVAVAAAAFIIIQQGGIGPLQIGPLRIEPMQIGPVDGTAEAATPTPPPTLAPTATASPPEQPAPPPLPSLPHLRHIEEKRHMLELINEARKDAGAPPVELGDNAAAQLHAESSLQNCFSSHWGIDGLKPYMRYSLAGGYQSNAENGHGSDYCIKQGDRYRELGSVKVAIEEAMEGWLDSSGHRRNLLDRHHKRVNIGLAWDRYNFSAYQHFEGDYVEYEELPSIENGILSISGNVKNGALIDGWAGLGVMIYYDRPPRELTRGQVSRTYCYNNGVQVASLREPVSWGSYGEHFYSSSYHPCPDPYDVPADARAARSPVEANSLWQEAYNASQSQKEQTITVPWITAQSWEVNGSSFSVTANISTVLNKHGDGVYSIVVWDRRDVVISEYSIFHGATPPNTSARH